MLAEKSLVEKAKPLVVTTFVVVTDSTLIEAGFEALAASYADLEMLGSGSAADDGGLMLRAQPDVVVIDDGMADGRALGICRAVARVKPVLVLSAELTDEAVRGSIDAGARGYLYKDVDTDVLHRTIRRLAAGQSVLDPRVTARVIDWASQFSFDASDETLSGREVEVVRRVARGESNKQIARHLGLSENTVKTYLRRVYRKLDCQGRSSAAAIVARRGIA